MTYRITLLALLASLLALPASAQIYKCRNADGRVEISNAPCPVGANTVKTVPEERISEAERLRAEREVERMRSYVEQREAAQRADNAAAAERDRQAAQRPSITVTGTSGNGRTTDDCLRDLDRQALQPMQREQMEAACRNNPQSQPVYVPVPVAVPAYNSGNPLGVCIQNVERANVSSAEKSRRISDCEARYAHPLAHPYARPETRPAPTTPQPANSVAVCPPNNKNCLKK